MSRIRSSRRTRTVPKTAFKKGTPKRGGRVKGTPNKLTGEVRAGVQMVCERKLPEFERWLDRTAVRSPAKAADLFLRAMEYFVPKLNRVEHVGENGDPIQHAMALSAKITAATDPVQIYQLYQQLTREARIVATQPAALPAPDATAETRQ